MPKETARGRRKPASKRARQPGRKAAQTATQATNHLTEADLAKIRAVVGEVVADAGGPELIDMNGVSKLTSLSHSSIRRLVRDDEFPKPIQLTDGRKAWIRSEVVAWSRDRIASWRAGAA